MPIIPTRVAVSIFLLISITAALFASKLTLLEDITAMLPDKGDNDQNLAELARKSGLMERVVIAVGPLEPGSDTLFNVMDRLTESLSNLDGIATIVGKIDTEGVKNAAMLLLERGPRLYRPGSKALVAEDFKAKLESLKKRLASPEALVMQPYLLADPLGFSKDALMGLEAAGSAMGAAIEQGRLVSADRRYGFIIAELDFDPFEVERSERFVKALDQTLSETIKTTTKTPVSFIAVGGVHFAASSAGAIRADVIQAFILTCVGIVLVFGLFFRRFRVLPVALIPGGIGIAVAAGLMGAAGVKLHALTLGFAATVTGISVDYVIHLLFRASRTTGDNSLVRMKTALRTIVRPVSLGCATTVAAFLIVSTSEFPGMRQLALFSCISIPVALFATLLLIPPFHRVLVGASTVRRTFFDRALEKIPELTFGGQGNLIKVGIIAVFTMISAASIYSATGVRFSGDPRDMGFFDVESEGRLEDLRRLMPGLDGQALIVTSATLLEDALQKNDALYNSLTGSGISPDKIISVSPFLPSRQAQERSLAEVNTLLNDSHINLKTVFKEAGFTKEFFAIFKDKKRSDPLTIKSFEGTGLMRLIGESVKESERGFSVITRVSTSTDEDLVILSQAVKQLHGCNLLSARGDASIALSTMQMEITRMLAVWICAALVLISLVQRSFFFGLRSLLPAIFGVACAAGIFGLLGRPMTPVATAGLTLVMGLGIDYGIFMQSIGGRKMRQEAAPAVFASALTTLVAFGVLAGSRTMAMADLGLIILVGVTAAVTAAIWLVPAVQGSLQVRGKL